MNIKFRAIRKKAKGREAFVKGNGVEILEIFLTGMQDLAPQISLGGWIFISENTAMDEVEREHLIRKTLCFREQVNYAIDYWMSLFRRINALTCTIHNLACRHTFQPLGSIGLITAT